MTEQQTLPDDPYVALQSPAFGRRCQAAAILGQHNDEPALLALLEAQADVDPRVRERVIEALGTFADPRARAACTQALADEDWWVRFQARAAIEQTRHTQGFVVLHDLLAHNDRLVRQRAVQALARTNHPDVVDVLLPLLNDTSALVASDVVDALAHIGERRTIAPLMALWHSDIVVTEGDSFNVYLALVRAFERFEVADVLIAALSDARWIGPGRGGSEWTMREQLIRALGRMRARRAVPVISTFLNDTTEFRGHFPLRSAAADALAMMRD